MGCANQQCPQGDTACTSAAVKYAGCAAYSTPCVDWANDFSHLASNDPLTANYYDCDSTCRPSSNTTTYWPIYKCKADCADVVFDERILKAVAKFEDAPKNPPTLFQFM